MESPKNEGYLNQLISDLDINKEPNVGTLIGLDWFSPNVFPPVLDCNIALYVKHFYS